MPSSAQPDIKEVLVLTWCDPAGKEPDHSKLRKHVAQLPLLGSALFVTIVSRVAQQCMDTMFNTYELTLQD